MENNKNSAGGKKITTEIISALLILLFVYAAVSKLIDHQHFAHFLTKIHLIAPMAVAISWVVPISELVISALLMSGSTRLFGLLSSLLLLLVFTGYLAFTLTLGTHVPCSCGGILQGMKWGPHIAFNTLFIILSFIAIILLKNPAHSFGRTLEVTH